MRVVCWATCIFNAIALVVTIGALATTPYYRNSGAEWIMLLDLCRYGVLFRLAYLCSRRKIEGIVILAVSVLVAAFGLPILILDAETPSTPYFSGFISMFALLAQGAVVLLLCALCLITLLVRRFSRTA